MDGDTTPLADMAVITHEFYESLVTAGFSPAQAMQIVCSHIMGAAMKPS